MTKRECPECNGKGYIHISEGAFKGINVECTHCDHGWVEAESYGLNAFAKEAREISKANGFDNPESISEGLLISQKLMLIVSECAEAMEVARKTQDLADFSDELADILIRTVDLSHDMGIDLDHVVGEKMEKNRKRGYKHGGRAF